MLEGQWIAAGCEDGSIQMWDGTKKIFVNVALENRQAHQVGVFDEDHLIFLDCEYSSEKLYILHVCFVQAGCEITSLAFSYDYKMLASRAFDDTLKIWDLR